MKRRKVLAHAHRIEEWFHRFAAKSRAIPLDGVGGARRPSSAPSRSQTLGCVVSGVAHDFINALTVLICEAEHMKRALADDDARHLTAEAIIESATCAASLTRQLLRYGGERTYEVHELEVNELVDGIQRLLQRVLGTEVGVMMELVIAPGALVTDLAQLERVLGNLVGAARDALPLDEPLTRGASLDGTPSAAVRATSPSVSSRAPRRLR